MTLDKELAKFLSLLDAQYGKDGYLLFLSADHGGAHNPNYLKSHKIYANGWAASDYVKSINAKLQDKYGVEKLVLAHYGDFFYLDHAKIERANLNCCRKTTYCTWWIVPRQARPLSLKSFVSALSTVTIACVRATSSPFLVRRCSHGNSRTIILEQPIANGILTMPIYLSYSWDGRLSMVVRLCLRASWILRQPFVPCCTSKCLTLVLAMLSCQ